ncbi:unnamed protein product [Rotaria magnacalcarata]|uniref:Uncharacterized protein n=1 Tax=Rotaria magnacalcarata TaxID=392030 RepID=A0A816NYX5_9BILA|nr:unnamed protein product [Rotaria magnacalcarata]
MSSRPRFYRQQIQRSDRNQRKGRNRLNHPRNGSNQQRRSQLRQPSRQRQQRRSGSRQIQLNDFMPTQLQHYRRDGINTNNRFAVLTEDNNNDDDDDNVEDDVDNDMPLRSTKKINSNKKD